MIPITDELFELLKSKLPFHEVRNEYYEVYKKRDINYDYSGLLFIIRRVDGAAGSWVIDYDADKEPK